MYSHRISFHKGLVKFVITQKALSPYSFSVNGFYSFRGSLDMRSEAYLIKLLDCHLFKYALYFDKKCHVSNMKKPYRN